MSLPFHFNWIIVLYYLCIFQFQCGLADSLVEFRKNGYKNDLITSGGGDLAYVKLLTTPRHKRDLSIDDYHILEIKVPAKNKTLTIHLSKESAPISPDLRTVVHDTENVFGGSLFEKYGLDESHDCLYIGVISEDPHGKAALSNCDKKSPGFSGVIIENNKHFLLQPFKEGKDEGLNVFTTESHIVHTIEETGCTISTSNLKNGINIPKYLHIQSPLRAKRGITTENEVDDQVIVGNLLDEDGNDNGLDSHLTPVGANIKKSTPGSKGKAKNKSKTKSKNDETVVDLAVYTDATLYRHFHQLFPEKDTVKKLKAYILTLINAINLIYHHPSLGMKVKIRLVHVEIMKTNPSNLVADTEGSVYLENFRRFAVKKNPKVDLWDHACLLTGIDIRTNGGGLLGMAYEGATCMPEYYTSLVRADNFESVYVGAHELGHNLGIAHDGSATNEQCPSATYLMSPHTGPGQVVWSPCSGKNLKQFIKYGTTQDNQKFLKDGPKCLDVQTKKNKAISYSSKLLPGEKYSAKDQCYIALGVGAEPVTESSNLNLCNNLQCTYPLYGETYVRAIHPALEGTKCGKDKYCRSGDCVKKK